MEEYEKEESQVQIGGNVEWCNFGVYTFPAFTQRKSVVGCTPSCAAVQD
jgi:hypothetical protein